MLFLYKSIQKVATICLFLNSRHLEKLNEFINRQNRIHFFKIFV